MPTTLNRRTFQKLIDENIQWLLNHTNAKETLEGRHIIDIVKHSVSAYYDPCKECEKLRHEKLALMIRLDTVRSELDSTRDMLRRTQTTAAEALDVQVETQKKLDEAMGIIKELEERVAELNGQLNDGLGPRG